ncbi:MAG: hypothetical protein Q7R70_06695 [Candidatus Diapherotrites archaeon]|nr:hypothetical protein [Candidatus Diapherotrites archaeon]
MDERKLRVVKFFAIIYILFGLSIIYLLHFNTGIEISGKPSGKGLEITVKNSSLHLIRDLNVSIIDQSNSESSILSLAELSPAAEKKVVIPGIHSANGIITIKANAMYHLEVLKQIKIEGAQDQNEEVSAVLEGPNKTFVNTQTRFKITICAAKLENQSVKITPDLESAFFTAAQEPKTIEVKAGQCGVEEFAFSPSNKGKTTIAFNIQIGSLNKRLEKEIEIID